MDNFTSLLTVLVDQKNIIKVESMKLYFNERVSELRTCYILSNVKIEILHYLIDSLNDDPDLHQMLDERYDSDNKFFFAFSPESYKFYVEDRRDKFTIDSYEWNSTSKVRRVYRRCVPSNPLSKIKGKVTKYLDFKFCMFRPVNSQYYVKFNSDCQGDPVVVVNYDTITAILEYCNNRELEAWLLSKQNHKLTWLQYNSNTTTIYLRKN